MGEKTYEVMSRQEIEGLTLCEVMNLPFDVDTDPKHRFDIDDNIHSSWQGLNEAMERVYPGFAEGKAVPISLSAAMAGLIVKILEAARLTVKK